MPSRSSRSSPSLSSSSLVQSSPYKSPMTGSSSSARARSGFESPNSSMAAGFVGFDWGHQTRSGSSARARSGSGSPKSSPYKSPKLQLNGKEKDVGDLRRNLYTTPFSFFVVSTFKGAPSEQQALLGLIRGGGHGGEDRHPKAFFFFFSVHSKTRERERVREGERLIDMEKLEV